MRYVEQQKQIKDNDNEIDSMHRQYGYAFNSSKYAVNVIAAERAQEN